MEIEVFLNLLRTCQRLCEQFDALFKAHGLTNSQYDALRILRGHDEPMPAGAVAREMVKREPDITRLLCRLEDAGYVSRDRCSVDKRVVLTHLTPEGAAVLAQLDDPVRSLHREQLAHMSQEDLRTLSNLLERAREKASERA